MKTNLNIIDAIINAQENHEENVSEILRTRYKEILPIAKNIQQLIREVSRPKIEQIQEFIPSYTRKYVNLLTVIRTIDEKWIADAEIWFKENPNTRVTTLRGIDSKIRNVKKKISKKVYGYDNDFSDLIRKGNKIFLKPIVNFLNLRLEQTFGENWIEITKYIYSNSSSNQRFLPTSDKNIKWDLYSISTFICLNNKKQKINNYGEETFDLRKKLFPDFRDDTFDNFNALRTIRNIISHPSFDGDNEYGFEAIDVNDALHYLRTMRFLVQKITNDKEALEKFKNIIKFINKYKV